MPDFLKVITDTPVPTLLVVAGIVFLFVGIGGELGAKMGTAGVRRRAAAAIGGILLVLGLGLNMAKARERDLQDKEAKAAPERPPAVNPPAETPPAEKPAAKKPAARKPAAESPPAENPPAVANEVVMGQIEPDVDRPGLDYRNFDLASAAPELCRDSCRKDTECKAWTYVRPNTIQGPRPRCWLKRSVASPVENQCCHSGIKLGD